MTSLQQAGHAGRLPGIQACALLCVEASVLQKVGSTSKETEMKQADESDGEGNNEGDELTYRKKVALTLCKFVEMQKCRRDVADKLFNNPPG